MKATSQKPLIMEGYKPKAPNNEGYKPKTLIMEGYKLQSRQHPQIIKMVVSPRNDGAHAVGLNIIMDGLKFCGQQ